MYGGKRKMLTLEEMGERCMSTFCAFFATFLYV